MFALIGHAVVYSPPPPPGGAGANTPWDHNFSLTQLIINYLVILVLCCKFSPLNGFVIVSPYFRIFDFCLL